MKELEHFLNGADFHPQEVRRWIRGSFVLTRHDFDTHQVYWLTDVAKQRVRVIGDGFAVRIKHWDEDGGIEVTATAADLVKARLLGVF